jgi:hypothetical protein
MAAAMSGKVRERKWGRNCSRVRFHAASYWTESFNVRCYAEEGFRLQEDIDPSASFSGNSWMWRFPTP